MIYLTIAVVVLLIANIILFALWRMENGFCKAVVRQLRHTEFERTVYESIIDGMFSDDESKKQLKDLKSRLGEALK